MSRWTSASSAPSLEAGDGESALPLSAPPAYAHGVVPPPSTAGQTMPAEFDRPPSSQTFKPASPDADALVRTGGHVVDVAEQHPNGVSEKGALRISTETRPVDLFKPKTSPRCAAPTFRQDLIERGVRSDDRQSLVCPIYRKRLGEQRRGDQHAKRDRHMQRGRATRRLPLCRPATGTAPSQPSQKRWFHRTTRRHPALAGRKAGSPKSTFVAEERQSLAYEFSVHKRQSHTLEFARTVALRATSALMPPTPALSSSALHRSATASYRVIVAGGVAVAVAGFFFYRWQCDDAYIAFRYAAQARAGHGLVWNAAPFRPVEGYSSFLWVLILSVVWTITGVPPPAASDWLSLLAGLLTLVLIAHWAWNLDLRGIDDRVRARAVALVVFGVALNRTFLMWLRLRPRNRAVQWAFSSVALRVPSRRSAPPRRMTSLDSRSMRFSRQLRVPTGCSVCSAPSRCSSPIASDRGIVQALQPRAGARL